MSTVSNDEFQLCMVAYTPVRMRLTFIYFKFKTDLFTAHYIA
jgi:hypothetical protein